MLDFPASPTINQQFSAAGSSWVWDGTAWNIVPQMVPAVASDTPPPNPAVGQFWWRASNGQLYLWYDDGNSKQWVQAAAPAQAPVTPARAWELIDDTVAAGVTSYNKTNLSAFEFLKLTGSVHPDATATAFVLYVSNNNGSSWVSGATDYFAQQVWGSGASAGANTASYNSIPFAAGSPVLPGLNAAGLTFELNLSRFNKTGYLRALLNLSVQTTGGVLIAMQTNAGSTVTTARNAISLQTAQPFSGHLFLEGVRG